MRLVLAVLGLALWMVELPIVDARFEPDDDGSDDDDDQYSMEDPEQTEEVPPSAPAGPVSPAAPISMKANALDRFGEQKAGQAGPGTISMSSSLTHFGQQHQAAPAAEAKATSPQQAQAAADAKNAHIAAETAKNAATVANRVAEHSVHVTEHAKSALENAHDALHKARVDSQGLSDRQKQSLKTAEAKLKEATKRAEYGKVKNAKYVKADVDNQKLQKMEDKMDKIKMSKEDDDVKAMQKEIADLRKQLKEKEGDKAEDDAELKQLSKDLEDLKEAEQSSKDKKSHDEMKAEIERLRAQIKSMKDRQASVSYTIPKEKKKPSHPMPAPRHHKEKREEDVERYDVKLEPPQSVEEPEEKKQSGSEATPVEEKGIDIDTAMPYGDLEPFGREDTAQELTESSIQESDGMVDQIERAEVSEEKRSVFRALTRLRGAAITSFDGVARSQTGNIDEYNKVHKWRHTHPLHHLADEESDISKWAFPDNAD